MAMLTVAKGLPLAYNKDLQEDKEGLFDTIDTVKFSLTVYAAMLRGTKVNAGAMRQALKTDFSNATDMADYLVKKGLPFRQAHEVVGKCVAYCLNEHKTLTDLTLTEFKEFSPLFAADILEAISVETCVAARNSLGGTSPTQVGQTIDIAKSVMEKQQKRLDMYTKIKL